ncbi:S9 family peptidase [Jeotgalibacillus salarius]|uniref:S9 family peptidase n=1 Tax=Jeotgalibacillus salarius TaxID=546023 RepID=A0A4Y8LAS0_9BACL|nr:S9 family peptidase [Jeotgalibacillus salarius]TFD99254.1 S9 family peptidase [Jeotgalibacillus salarius]
MTQKRHMTAEDLYKIESLTDPRWSPDGQNVLFVKTHINEEHTYTSNLFLLDQETGDIEQWTYGDHKVSSPRWSPDGKKVAFVSNRSGKNQLFVLPVKGGEAKQVTDTENGAGNPVWSPCSGKLAFTASLEPKDSLIEKKEKEDEDKKLKPYVTDSMKYKADGAGLLDDKKQQIAVIDLASEEISQLTKGEDSYSLFAWSPDGKQLAFATDADAKEKDFSFNNELYLYNIEDDSREKIKTAEGYVGFAAWSPEGDQLAFTAAARTYENATHSEVWVWNKATGVSECLTEGIDAPAGDYAIGDIQQGANVQGAVWADNKSLYFVITDQGNVNLYYASTEGEVYPAYEGAHHVYGFDVHGASQKIAAAISTTENPGDLHVIHVPTGEASQVTNVNKQLLEEVEIVVPETVAYESTDGYTVHGWFMKPAGFKDGEEVPMILNIHGGPHAMYGNTFFHEMQLLAAEGYAVLYTNPRGSHGYGQEFVNAVRGDYGGGDYRDLMVAVDGALEQFDFIDAERLGVTGGSYGGFMTNWITGHTDRFKAAVTQRCISNWISFYGVSDIGYYFSEWQIQADLGDIDTLWKHSPLAYADQINTPLLIMHSENDYRCPIEQSEQLYIALKRKEKKTRLVRFPESDHNLSRTGKPELRLERLNHLAGWMKEYI